MRKGVCLGEAEGEKEGKRERRREEIVTAASVRWKKRKKSNMVP